mmetsp:Transcript_52920/g.126329  ORF Transcript_52920/g.126329 Transcript_52920/m.126329 type:complete len:85 (-) Transcript_52920:8-262(-)
MWYLYVEWSSFGLAFVSETLKSATVDMSGGTFCSNSAQLGQSTLPSRGRRLALICILLPHNDEKRPPSLWGQLARRFDLHGSPT